MNFPLLLRFLLRQPSPNWKSFSIEDIAVGIVVVVLAADLSLLYLLSSPPLLLPAAPSGYAAVGAVTQFNFAFIMHA